MGWGEGGGMRAGWAGGGMVGSEGSGRRWGKGLGGPPRLRRMGATTCKLRTAPSNCHCQAEPLRMRAQQHGIASTHGIAAGDTAPEPTSMLRRWSENAAGSPSVLAAGPAATTAAPAACDGARACATGAELPAPPEADDAALLAATGRASAFGAAPVLMVGDAGVPSEAVAVSRADTPVEADGAGDDDAAANGGMLDAGAEGGAVAAPAAAAGSRSSFVSFGVAAAASPEALPVATGCCGCAALGAPAAGPLEPSSLGCSASRPACSCLTHDATDGSTALPSRRSAPANVETSIAVDVLAGRWRLRW